MRAYCGGRQRPWIEDVTTVVVCDLMCDERCIRRTICDRSVHRYCIVVSPEVYVKYISMDGGDLDPLFANVVSLIELYSNSSV